MLRALCIYFVGRNIFFIVHKNHMRNEETGANNVPQTTQPARGGGAGLKAGSV